MIFLSKVISKIKGEAFVLDNRIPLSYLFRFFFSRFICLCWGMLRLFRLRRVFIHPSSIVKCARFIHCGKNFSVGEKSYLNALSIFGFNCGDNVSIGYHTHIELTGSLKLLGQGMWVGDNVGLGSHGHYGSGAGKLIIGNNTIFGNYVSIHPENHNYSDASTLIREQGVHSVGGVKIGSNCWIGAKVTFLDGAEIGDNCIVAAGAVVTKKFPSNVIIGGVPAKVIKEYR